MVEGLVGGELFLLLQLLSSPYPLSTESYTNAERATPNATTLRRSYQCVHDSIPAQPPPSTPPPPPPLCFVDGQASSQEPTLPFLSLLQEPPNAGKCPLVRARDERDNVSSAVGWGSLTLLQLVHF